MSGSECPGTGEGVSVLGQVRSECPGTGEGLSVLVQVRE